jgi:uncharacterized membrane protein
MMSAPEFVLIVVTLLVRLAGRFGVAALGNWATAARAGMAAMLCVTASAHFSSLRPDLVRMVPPAIPNPEFMVTLTGVCEILGAIGLLVPRTRRIAAAALVLLFLALLPANIHAAQAGLTISGDAVEPVGPRIALQALFIAIVWWAGWRSKS